ncbi:hypothetical protein [Mycobacterium basiliense]|nr:hypothetical protein [Mycobacterium basiliense]
MTKTALLVTGDGLPRGVSGAADPHFFSALTIFARLSPGGDSVGERPRRF